MKTLKFFLKNIFPKMFESKNYAQFFFTNEDGIKFTVEAPMHKSVFKESIESEYVTIPPKSTLDCITMYVNGTGRVTAVEFPPSGQLKLVPGLQISAEAVLNSGKIRGFNVNVNVESIK